MKKELTSRLFYTWMLLAFAAFGLSGSQCARVSDRATGPILEPNTVEYARCVKQCNDDAQAARRAELELFQLNMANCTTAECKDAEEARHEAAMEQIDLDQEACKEACHEQGSGTGGQ